MPKKQILGTVIIIIILSFICMYIYDNYKMDVKTTIVVNYASETGIVNYYQDSKDNKYYLYDLDDIIIDFNDRTLTLDRALSAKQIDFDFIYENLKKEYSINDDKVVFYKNEDFSLLECRNGDNTNYIFGPSTMNYKESLCSDKPYICSFEVSYNILDITQSKDNEFSYITLSNGEEVETIKISIDNIQDLASGNIYKFTFGSLNGNIDKSIKDIFNNNILIGFELTDAINNKSLCN